MRCKLLIKELSERKKNKKHCYKCDMFAEALFKIKGSCKVYVCEECLLPLLKDMCNEIDYDIKETK